MKKAISLLLGVLLIGSLAGFSYGNDPLRAYTNAANRAYKAGAMETTYVTDTLIERSDGTVEDHYKRAESRDIGTLDNMQSTAKIIESVDGELCESTSYYKDNWHYEKLEGDFSFQSTDGNAMRREIPNDQLSENFWYLIHDYVGEERLAKSAVTFGSANNIINIRVPREAANEWLAEKNDLTGIENMRIDSLEGRVVLDDKGRIEQENLTCIYLNPEAGGNWERQTVIVRSFFTWPADTTPIEFPDDLNSYPISKPNK